jgi:hypothetical protein
MIERLDISGTGSEKDEWKHVNFFAATKGVIET